MCFKRPEANSCNPSVRLSQQRLASSVRRRVRLRKEGNTSSSYGWIGATLHGCAHRYGCLAQGWWPKSSLLKRPRKVNAIALVNSKLVSHIDTAGSELQRHIVSLDKWVVCDDWIGFDENENRYRIGVSKVLNISYLIFGCGETCAPFVSNAGEPNKAVLSQEATIFGASRI